MSDIDALGGLLNEDADPEKRDVSNKTYHATLVGNEIQLTEEPTSAIIENVMDQLGEFMGWSTDRVASGVANDILTGLIESCEEWSGYWSAAENRPGEDELKSSTIEVLEGGSAPHWLSWCATRLQDYARSLKECLRSAKETLDGNPQDSSEDLPDAPPMSDGYGREREDQETAQSIGAALRHQTRSKALRSSLRRSGVVRKQHYASGSGSQR